MSDHNERACSYCGSLLHHESKCPDDMGVNCPKCKTRITIQNAGGWRTFCADCVEEAQKEEQRKID